MQGLAHGPRFERIRIPTVDAGFFERVHAAFQRPRIRLLEDFHVPMPDGSFVTLPATFESDGGSVPMFTLWLLMLAGYCLNTAFGGWWFEIALVAMLLGLMLNAFGLMLVPYLLHDFAVRYRELIIHGKPNLRVRSWAHANTLMRRSVYSVNDMIFLGMVAHGAVSLFVWSAWRKHRANDASGINEISQFNGVART